MSKIIEEILETLSPSKRRTLFNRLREEFKIHPLEEELNTSAEIILESIHRASDLTKRGIRGVIAEAAFEIDVVKHLNGWRDTTPTENLPFDFRLEDALGPVTFQVKLQRSKEHRPMTANEGYVRFSSDMYVVEPQKTRAGKKKSTGEDTRPYRFGEFDILAVCMQPSARSWDKFMYTVGDWLLPRPGDPSLILKFQPIPKLPNDDWTDDCETAVEWFRSGVKKSIRYTPLI